MEKKTFDVIGMTCAACQNAVERATGKLEGVSSANVSLISNTLTIEYDPALVTPAQIEQAVDQAGYQAVLQGEILQENDLQNKWDTRREKVEKEQKEKRRIVLTSIILLAGLYCVSMLPMLGIFSFWMSMEWMMVSTLIQIIVTLFILFIQRSFFIRGFKALLKRSPNMDSLVAIGAAAALVYGIYAAIMMAHGYGLTAEGNMEGHMIIHEAMDSLYLESAATIVTLVSLGKYLEARSKAKTSAALEKLVDLAPKSALVERNGVTMEIASSEVLPGDIVIIRPGTSIPVDGIVLSGTGYVDQAALTGESLPVEKNQGDEVMSATMNINGTFRFEATHVGNDTTLAKIIRLVEEAGNTKAPIARLADKVSGIFVPVVIGLSLLTLIGWIIAGQSFTFALSNAITVLVISCPCALGLATPLAIMVSTGKAAEYGILVKNATALETLKSVKVVVLDKTGTITSGKPEVVAVESFDPAWKKDQLLALAGKVEEGSEHPLGKAIVQKFQELKLEGPEVYAFEAIGGKGIKAQTRDGNVIAGNLALIKEQGFTLNESILSLIDAQAKQGRTPILFALDGKLLGLIAVADTVRPDSRKALEDLKSMGIETVMLTGDNQATARAIASDLAIDEVISDVLPTDKEAQVRRLQEQGKIVAMVGDGINDAPALMRADVGIAIGAGTDIAIESADVVLMKDSLLDVVLAIDLSKKTISNIRENLFWAFFYNALFIPVAMGFLYPVFGWLLSPMMAALAMSLSSVSVCLNALRLRFFNPKRYQLEVETLSHGQVEEARKEDELALITLEEQEKEEVEDSIVLSFPNLLDSNRLLADISSLAGIRDLQLDQKANQIFILKNKEFDYNSLLAVLKNDGYQDVTISKGTQKPEMVDFPKSDTLNSGDESMNFELNVKGMSCDHCVKRVSESLSKVDGVNLVTIDLPTGKASIQTSKPVDQSLLVKAIEDAGYEVEPE